MSERTTSEPGPKPRPAVTGRARGLPRTLGDAWPVFLRHRSPRLLAAALAAAATARAALGDFGAADLAAAGGLLLVWPVQEWLIHVFILHAKPRRILGRSVDFRVPRAHRAHHRDPWDLELVFIPFHSFLYSLPLLVALWLAIARSLPVALTGITAHLALALHYEWVHYLVHTAVVPRTRLYARLWKNHRRHHFKNESYWYGVTMLGGDRLLGTAPPFDAVPASPTARTLGVELSGGA